MASSELSVVTRSVNDREVREGRREKSELETRKHPTESETRLLLLLLETEDDSCDVG